MPKTGEGVRDVRSLPPAQYSDPFRKQTDTQRKRGEENGVYMRYSKRGKKNRPGSVNIYTYGPRSSLPHSVVEILETSVGYSLIKK